MEDTIEAAPVASKIFSSISVFSMLRSQLDRIASQSVVLIQGLIAPKPTISLLNVNGYRQSLYRASG